MSASAVAPILTIAQLAAADRAAGAGGLPLGELMDRAGRAVAAAVRARWSPRPVLVLCGPGDNGGDGYVAATALAQAGWPVRVMAGAPPRSGAAQAAAQAWTGERLALDDADAAMGPGALVIDALFGAGVSRPLAPELAGLLARAGEGGRALVAVDAPSGLQGDTGRPLGEVAPVDLTVTFHARKPAHVLEPGAALCGEVVVADIGLAPFAPIADPPLWVNGPALWSARFPWPAVDAHKSRRGALNGGERRGAFHGCGAAGRAGGAAHRGGAGHGDVSAVGRAGQRRGRSRR